MRQTGAVNARKALWWGRWGKVPYPQVLRYSFQSEPVSIAECVAFCSETSFFIEENDGAAAPDSLLRFAAVLRRGEGMTDGNLGLQYREKTGTL